MKRVIQFTKTRFAMITLSAVLIIGGLAATIARGGLNLGIDFEAGLSYEVAITGGAESLRADTVREVVDELGSVQVQALGQPEDGVFTIRVRDDGSADDFAVAMSSQINQLLTDAFPGRTVTERSVTTIGPRFSADLAQRTAFLTALALGLILVYIWFRFRLGYAVSAISALVHDVLFMVAFVGAFQIEVNTGTIAAILTIIGYSLNDTIVIFDRIRENEQLLHDSSFETTVNTSISQSLSRTIITSLTTLLAVAAIFVFAVGDIRFFALNLIVGVVVGTYSSIFVASPALLGWQKIAAKRRKRIDQEKYGTGDPAKGDTAVLQKGGAAGVSTVGVDRVREELIARHQQAAEQRGGKARKPKRK